MHCVKYTLNVVVMSLVWFVDIVILYCCCFKLALCSQSGWKRLVIMVETKIYLKK